MINKRTSHHRLAVMGLFVLALVAGLFWSLRSLGYPDPANATRSATDIAEMAARDRQSAILSAVFQCLDAVGSRKPTNAIGFCNRAITLDPDNTAALRLRGVAYDLQGNMPKAIADFTRAIKVAPSDVDAYRFRGMAYYASGRQASALADFSRAVSLNPADPLSHQARGFQYEIMGSLTGAIDDFSFAIMLDPTNADYWNSRCWAQAIFGRHLHHALGDCNQAIVLNPKLANAFDSRGLVLLRLARYSQSVQSYTMAIRLNRALASAYFGRGVAKRHLVDPSAFGDLAVARRIEPNIDARFEGYGVHLPTTGSPGA